MSREELLESDDGSPDVRRAKALFRGFYEALSDEIEQVRALGGEVKDIEIGLVDFPARRRGEEILLCWRLGEKTIGFWHAVEAGFAGRRPDRRRRRARAAAAGLSGRAACRASRQLRAAVEALLRASGLDPATIPISARRRARGAAVAGGVPGRLRHGSRGDPRRSGDGRGRSRRGRGGRPALPRDVPAPPASLSGRRARRLPAGGQAGRVSAASPSWSTASPSG